MKLKISKFHTVIVAISFLFIIAFSFSLYYWLGNSVDKRLENLARELSIAQINKNCKENARTDEECQALKDKIMSNTDANRLEYIAGINKECKDKNFTESQCEQYKEIKVKELREAINATSPFSELDPQVRGKLEEMGNDACKLQNLSDEECKKTKVAVMKLGQEKHAFIVNMVKEQCREAGLSASDEKCKEIESKLLEKFKNETLKYKEK